MITDAHRLEFEEFGATTIDSPFIAEEIERGGQAIADLHGRPKTGGYADYVIEPVLLDFIQHPFFETAAREVLLADEVEFVAWAARQNDPQPGAQFAMLGEHVDISYNRAALDATPRRMLASFLLWFTDTNLERGPFMYRRGSHRQIAEHFGDAPVDCDNPLYADDIPRLDYADPEPLVARAGQVSVVTTALVHSGSVNVGTLPRRVMFIVYKPKGVEIRFNMRDAERRREYMKELRGALRPERRHLVAE